jgi:hypothetical protein
MLAPLSVAEDITQPSVHANREMSAAAETGNRDNEHEEPSFAASHLRDVVHDTLVPKKTSPVYLHTFPPVPTVTVQLPSLLLSFSPHLLSSTTCDDSSNVTLITTITTLNVSSSPPPHLRQTTAPAYYSPRSRAPGQHSERPSSPVRGSLVCAQLMHSILQQSLAWHIGHWAAICSSPPPPTLPHGPWAVRDCVRYHVTQHPSIDSVPSARNPMLVLPPMRMVAGFVGLAVYMQCCRSLS